MGCYLLTIGLAPGKLSRAFDGGSGRHVASGRSLKILVQENG
jgi:hypothetical protein